MSNKYAKRICGWIADRLRLVEWAAFAAALLVGVYFLEPQALELVVLKLAEVCLFAFVGYWADRSIFPYSRCGFGETDAAERASQLRRAIIVAACVVGGCLAL